MKIFIDESGAFLPPATRDHLVSCVTALVVSSADETRLFKEFLSLRAEWGCGSEAKGSTLAEEQVAAVITLLREFGVLCFVVAIDMAGHTEHELRAYQQVQADKITEHLSPEYKPEVAAEMRALRETTLALPVQLFVQSRLMLVLIPDLFRSATMFYAQHLPAELGHLDWIIDAKDTNVTPMERLWSTVLMPSMEREFLEKPLIMLEGADYGHLERFALALTEEDRRHLEWLETTRSSPTSAGLLTPISMNSVMWAIGGQS